MKMVKIKNLILVVVVFLVIFDQSLCKKRRKPHNHKKRKALKKKSVYDYLDDYGYKPVQISDGRGYSRRSGIMKFQAFAGIPVTGRMDDKTKNMLTKPRCGAKDKIWSNDARKKRYTTRPSGWNKKLLTYSILHKSYPSEKINFRQVLTTLSNAFTQWSKVTGIVFRRTSNNNLQADIKISFHSGYHGDDYPFDGKGHTIAHAFYPDTFERGKIHFDDDEVWTLNSPDSTNMDFLWTSLHEIGHSLGLEHSADPDAIMTPWYPGYRNEAFTLQDDDIAGIQTIYGVPTPPEPINKKKKSMVCYRLNRGFDAAVYSKTSGEMYLFQGNQVWTMDNMRYISVIPEYITSKWPSLTPKSGLPVSIDAAYANKKGQLFFFRGDKFYYSNNMKRFYGPYSLRRLIKNYDQHQNKLNKIDGVMSWHRNGRTYFFNGDLYWRYNEQTRRIDRGYPLKIAPSWKGVNFKVGAVTDWKNRKTFFFNGRNVYRLDDRKIALIKKSTKQNDLKHFIKNCRN